MMDLSKKFLKVFSDIFSAIFISIKAETLSTKFPSKMLSGSVQYIDIRKILEDFRRGARGAVSFKPFLKL